MSLKHITYIEMESIDQGTKHFRGVLNILVTIATGDGYERREEKILVDMHVRDGKLNMDYPFIQIET